MNPAFIVADKPAGITSHDVVAAVKAVTGVKVGHTGTLDPFATGVLPLALGGATRLIQFLDERIKIYDATIALGHSTTTGDPTGEVLVERSLPTLDRTKVLAVLRDFIGERDQTPPPYSAVKYKGKPLYWYARRGEVVSVPSRRIEVFDLELLELHRDSLRVLLTCSRGTYARVLADEIAGALGTAGHLSALSRTRSGPFTLDDAITLPQLAEIVAPGHSWERVLMFRGPRTERIDWRPRDDVRAGIAPWLRQPLTALSHLPLVDCRGSDAHRVRAGGPPPPPTASTAPGARYLLVSGEALVAVCEQGMRTAKVLRVLDKGGVPR